MNWPLSHYSIDCYSLPPPISLCLLLNPPFPSLPPLSPLLFCWMAVKVEYFEDNSQSCLGNTELAAKVRGDIGSVFRAVVPITCNHCPCSFDISCWFISAVRLWKGVNVVCTCIFFTILQTYVYVFMWTGLIMSYYGTKIAAIVTSVSLDCHLVICCSRCRTHELIIFTPIWSRAGIRMY